MGEFRIGRRFAHHSYPDTRSATTVPYARNFAVGPATNTAVAASPGTQVPWSAIEVGSPGVDVPITPRSTGVIHVDGVLTVQNTTEGNVDVQVQVQLNGSTSVLPATEKVTVRPGFDTIPINIDIPAPQVVGTTKDVEILVTAASGAAIQLIANSCSLEVLEEPAPTG